MGNFFTVDESRIFYKEKELISTRAKNHTKIRNQIYSLIAGVYGIFITLFIPFWRRCLRAVLPQIKGTKILDVSFGDGYLMTKYGKKEYELYGIEFNTKMIEFTSKRLKKNGIKATLSHSNVESLPFPSNSFDTVINTGAFIEYPNGKKAMSEMHRVLKPGGKLIIVDIGFPKNRNFIAVYILKFWMLFDNIKDIPKHLKDFGFDFKDQEMGLLGMVHMFIANKKKE